MSILLSAAGLFTLGLSIWHLGVPRWFDFRDAIDPEGPERPLRPLRPLVLGPLSRPNSRGEVLGITWVMSYAASYVLISVGVADLVWATWLGTPMGRLLAVWICGWWAVRAVS
ncbi:hypothetical protein BH20CHL6_BH20CHL6_03900 [soil metagenome]